MEPFAVTAGCYLLSKLRHQMFLLYLICPGNTTLLPGPLEDVKSIPILLELWMLCECSQVPPALIFLTATHTS